MLFIAEIGMNHNGNFDLCLELIKQAKYSGADIAKIQLGWKSEKGQLNFVDLPMLRKLKKWSHYVDIELMASIITPGALGLAREVGFDRYKIASRTLKDNLNLMHQIVEEGKETFISLGMWEEHNLPIQNNNKVKYLWCKSMYPCTPWDLKDLPKDFVNSKYHGYSDHSIGIDIPLLAISRGAKIIEKHFSLDKSDNTIRDHILSATPEEFKTLTQIGRNISKNIDLGI